MLWVCKLLQLNHLRLQTLVRLVAKPTYQPHQTLRHGWIYEITFWNAQFTLWKKINWLLYFWINIVDLMLVPFRFGLQEPPPQKKHHLLTHQLSINTSVFHQASLGHTGTLHRIPGSAVNCNKEWQRAPWPAEILLGTDGGVPLLVYEGFLAICQNSIHHSLLPWSSTKIFCYLLAYIYIENIYIYIYVDS